MGGKCRFLKLALQEEGPLFCYGEKRRIWVCIDSGRVVDLMMAS